jgi:hypothetical protein
MGVCDFEYPYFTMKPKRLQRRSKFHAMFVKDFSQLAVDEIEPGYVRKYSKIDLLHLSLLCQVFPVIKRLQNFLYWSIIYCGPIHYSFIKY